MVKIGTSFALLRTLGGFAALAACCATAGCGTASPSDSEGTDQVSQALGCGVLGPGQTLTPPNELVGCDHETILQNGGGQLALSYDDGTEWTSPNSVPGGTAEMQTNGDFVLWSPDHSIVVWHTGTASKSGSTAGSGGITSSDDWLTPDENFQPSCPHGGYQLQIDPAGFALEVVDVNGNICWRAP
jgi:hypothetical protein